MSKSPAPKAPKAQSAGELDELFGLRTLKFPGASKTISKGVAITPSGKIMVSATVERSGHSYYGLARLDANGNPDSSFGEAGYLTGHFGTPLLSQGGHLLVDADDGLIWMCGVIGIIEDEVIKLHQVIARFLPDGSPDIAFGDDRSGYQIVPTRIPLLSGATHGRFILTKSTPQVEGADGLLFVTSQNGSGLLTRLLRGGANDPSFADKGWLVLTLPKVAISLSGIIQLANGLILVHGKIEVTNQGLVMAFDSSGNVAEQFGDKGVLVLNIQRDGKPLESHVENIVAQTAERLLLLGSAVESTQGMKLQHGVISGITDAGQMDTAFENPVITPAIQTLDLRSWKAGFALNDIDDGRIVAVGQTSGNSRGLLTGGFEVDGAVDDSFDIEGAKDISWPAIDACLQGSSILVLGRKDDSAQLVRLLTAAITKPAQRRRR
ncbi:NHL repeat-containing protein [Pseudomonas mercuritolerans]|uniref:Delta-60 repeat domain-containing protein n=1 Tax=Pseudomonas mercuritolerans TaxID=2951809 RepID=A0ABT2XWE7_9PSED|nr:hypothetical protein [Pseudomonas mercuritolerans]MCV2223013.1 hypothetical protein [Pseudomonas mercuritolerans]